MNKYAGILLAAGKGSRCGAVKQFTQVGKQMLFQYALQAMLESCIFEQVIIVVPAESEGVVKHLYQGGDIDIVVGAADRWRSIGEGVKAVQEPVTHIIWHDACRPWIKGKHFAMVRSIIEGPGAAGLPVATIKKVVDILISVSEGRWVPGSREISRCAQTPVGFNKSTLDEVLYDMENTGYAGLETVGPRSVIGEFIAKHGKFAPFELPDYNGKVTTAWDLEFARSYFNAIS